MRSSTTMRVIGAGLAILAGVTGAFAQQPMGLRQEPAGRGAFIERQRELELENEERLQRDLPVSQKFEMQWGGWLNSYFFLFDDGAESSRTLRQNELRVWTSFTADRGIHQGFLRVRGTYFDWNHGDSYNGNDDDLDGPNLERGWYRFDLARYLRLYESQEAPYDLSVKLGRDLVTVGSGYAINLPLDHAELDWTWKDVQLRVIGGWTPFSTENIDRSRPVADHSDRHFWILETTYHGFDKHTPFAYAAWQDDHTKEDPPNPLQGYRYDSQYFGIGSMGELARNLRYTTEWVLERGESYGNRRFLGPDDIQAWAFDNRLDYFVRHRTKPIVSLEYMFASGDADRIGSPSNAVGGNRNDYTDNGFNGFGFRDTGLSFFPRLSNIHAWRLGGSFRPWPEVQRLKDLELGSDWFLYSKHHRDAAVSDGFASEQSSYLGWEMDYYANYRLWSDVALTLRYGVFFPGKAFEDQTTRTFLFTGLTWSF